MSLDPDPTSQSAKEPVGTYRINSEPGWAARTAKRATSIALGFAIVLNLAVLIVGVHWFFSTPHGSGAKLDMCGADAGEAIGAIASVLGKFIGVPITIWAFFKIAKASTPLLLVLAIVALLLNLSPEWLNLGIFKVMMVSHPAGVTASGCTQ